MTNYLFFLYNPENEDTSIIVQTNSLKDSLSEANAGGKEKWIPYARIQTYYDPIMDDVYALIRATGKEKDKNGNCPRNGIRVNVSVQSLHTLFEKIERINRATRNWEFLDDQGEPYPPEL